MPKLSRSLRTSAQRKRSPARNEGGKRRWEPNWLKRAAPIPRSWLFGNPRKSLEQTASLQNGIPNLCRLCGGLGTLDLREVSTDDLGVGIRDEEGLTGRNGEHCASKADVVGRLHVSEDQSHGSRLTNGACE